MAYLPGDLYYKVFVTNNISGVSTNADSTPLGVLDRNGVDDFSTSAKVYISNIDIGRYNVSGQIPFTYVGGNSVAVTVSGSVAGNQTKSVFDLGVLDRAITSIAVTGFAPSNFIGINSISPGVTVSITGTAPNYFIVPNSIRDDVAVAVTGALPQVILASGGIDQINIDDSTNFRQAISIMAAVIAGSSVVNGNNIAYYSISNGSKSVQRVNATAVSGSRQSLVLFLPA